LDSRPSVGVNNEFLGGHGKKRNQTFTDISVRLGSVGNSQIDVAVPHIGRRRPVAFLDSKTDERFGVCQKYAL
jgi:hypothetical protein